MEEKKIEVHCFSIEKKDKLIGCHCPFLFLLAPERALKCARTLPPHPLRCRPPDSDPCPARKPQLIGSRQSSKLVSFDRSVNAYAPDATRNAHHLSALPTQLPLSCQQSAIGGKLNIYKKKKKEASVDCFDALAPLSARSRSRSHSHVAVALF